jgi:hypothetical protein
VREHAVLWIQDAVDAGAVIRFKRPDIKTKHLLPSTLSVGNDGKEIPKHEGSSPGKKRNTQTSTPSNSTQKAKHSKGTVNGLQLLQAELKQQNSSPLFGLVQSAAAGVL